MELNPVSEDRVELALKLYKKLTSQKKDVEAHEQLLNVVCDINGHK